MNIFKGITGDYEWGRVIAGLGTLFVVVAPVVFQGIDTYKNGHWDAAAFIAAYSLGVSGVVSSSIISIGNKEKNVAVARATQASTDAVTGASA